MHRAARFLRFGVSATLHETPWQRAGSNVLQQSAQLHTPCPTFQSACRPSRHDTRPTRTALSPFHSHPCVRLMCTQAPPQQPPSPPPAGTQTAQPWSMDVDETSFMSYVMQSDVPVILDCHAEWCGPCRQLGPALERIVQSAGGRLRLAKLDVDANDELAGKLQVRSLPTVFGVCNGRVVDQFVGMPPPERLQAFIDGLIKQGGGATAAGESAETIESLTAAGNQALEAEDADTARTSFQKALTMATEKEDTTSAALALTGLVRCALQDDNIEAAQELVGVLQSQYRSDVVSNRDMAAVIARVELASGGADQSEVGQLKKRIEDDPNDLQARHDLALALAAVGQTKEAIDQGLAIVKIDRGWENGAGQQLLLKLFEAGGTSSPDVIEGRKRLSNMLFA